MFAPTLNNILVKPIVKKDKIILAEDSNEMIIGKVVATGNGTKNSPMEVGERYKVYFYKRNSRELNLKNKIFYLLDQSDILVYEIT